MTIEHFTKANEGTYTIQIHDGKAKSQSSLVLVGDGEGLTVCAWYYHGIFSIKKNAVTKCSLCAFLKFQHSKLLWRKLSSREKSTSENKVCEPQFKSWILILTLICLCNHYLSLLLYSVLRSSLLRVPDFPCDGWLHSYACRQGKHNPKTRVERFDVYMLFERLISNFLSTCLHFSWPMWRKRQHSPGLKMMKKLHLMLHPTQCLDLVPFQFLWYNNQRTVF